MTKFKHIKLFESFVNEELSPELKKRAYDKMFKISNDPNSIDNLKRRDQAHNVLSSLTPAVEKLKNELVLHATKVFPDEVQINVSVYDYGLTDGNPYLNLYVNIGPNAILGLTVYKDKYEKSKSEVVHTKKLYSDRAFVNTLKKLIVQIQKDEIPGDEQVPAQPESITPEGSIN